MGVVVMFPHSRLIGLARRLIDMSETRTTEEMSAIWEAEMDVLEARMSYCGFGLDEWTVQIPALYDLVKAENYRRAYEGRRHQEPDEAA